MNAKTILTIVAALTFGVRPAADATDWADFSQSNTFVTVNSENPQDATVLRTVTVVCPVKGYLIAQAESVFNLTQSSFFSGRGSFQHSLTLDSVAPIARDPEHQHVIERYDPDGVMLIPASIQRIVSCTAGQSVTVNYVSSRIVAGITHALQPKLSVDFFDKRI